MDELTAAAEEWYEFPCSKVQERFWAGDQLGRGRATLNIALRWRLEGAATPERIAQTLRQLTARHEILRTAFCERDGRPVQRILPHVEIHVPVVDLRLMAKPDRDREFERICIEEARRPFDLTDAPLLRVQLLQLGEHESFLLITAHHIVADGWSMGIIAREFCALCNAAINGAVPVLPPLPIQYSDYAVWEAEWQGSEAVAAEEAYWAGRLAGFEPFAIPTDHPRSAAAAANAAITSVLLPPDLTRTVEVLARAHGVTWFIAILTGVVLVLAKRRDTTDVTVGTQVAGRDQTELEGVVGPFTNTILLRMDLAGVTTVEEALGRIGEAVYEALDRGHVPLERVLDAVTPRRGTARCSPLRVNVLQQRAFDEVFCSDLTLRGIPSVSTGATFDLNFFVVERTEGWRLSCEYDTDLFEEKTVAGILREALGLLADAAVNAQRPLAGFPLRMPAPEPPEESPAEGLQPQAQWTGTDTERRVLSLVNEVLGADGADLDTPFFDRGGSSLDAIRLITRVAAVFGAGLSLEAFLKNPTARELAALLDNRPRLVDDPRATTIALQPEGRRTPVIALHNTFLFQELSQRIGPDRPFHCVVPGDIYDDSGATYESIVAHYVEGIRRVRPHGPYVLLGHCFAGRLAYEAAQQLTRAGERVKHVIVVDGWAPGHVRRKSRARAVLSRGSYELLRFLKRVRNLLGRRLTWGRIIFKSKVRLGLSPMLEAEEVSRVCWVESRLSDHPVDVYYGPILVIRALDEPHGLFIERDLAWGKLAVGRLDVRDIPGTHFTMFREPQVALLAAAIREVIDRGSRPQAGERGGAPSHAWAP